MLSQEEEEAIHESIRADRLTWPDGCDHVRLELGIAKNMTGTSQDTWNVTTFMTGKKRYRKKKAKFMLPTEKIEHEKIIKSRAYDWKMMAIRKGQL